METRIASIGRSGSTSFTDAPDGTRSGNGNPMHDADDGNIELPEHLRDIDKLLRLVADFSPAPPDGLCHTTLERCFSRLVNKVEPSSSSPFTT